MLSRLNFVFVAAFLMAAVLVGTLQAEIIVLHDDFDDGVLDTSKWSTMLGTGATIVEEDGVVKIHKGSASSADRAFLVTVGEWEPAIGAEVTVSGKITLNSNSHFDVWFRASDYFDQRPWTVRPWNGSPDFGVVCDMSPNANGQVVGFEKLPSENWTSFGTPDTPTDGTVTPPYWGFLLTDNGTDVTMTVTEVADPTNTATFTGSSNVSEGGFHVLLTGNDVYLDEITITQVPEPSTLALLAAGLIGLLCYAWRKRK